jgi:hypothetical protein
MARQQRSTTFAQESTRPITTLQASVTGWGTYNLESLTSGASAPTSNNSARRASYASVGVAGDRRGDGNVVGLPDPLAMPRAAAGYVGTLPAGTYYVADLGTGSENRRGSTATERRGKANYRTEMPDSGAKPNAVLQVEQRGIDGAACLAR